MVVVVVAVIVVVVVTTTRVLTLEPIFINSDRLTGKYSVRHFGQVEQGTAQNFRSNNLFHIGSRVPVTSLPSILDVVRLSRRTWQRSDKIEIVHRNTESGSNIAYSLNKVIENLFAKQHIHAHLFVARKALYVLF